MGRNERPGGILGFLCALPCREYRYYSNDNHHNNDHDRDNNIPGRRKRRFRRSPGGLARRSSCGRENILREPARRFLAAKANPVPGGRALTISGNPGPADELYDHNTASRSLLSGQLQFFIRVPTIIMTGNTFTCGRSPRRTARFSLAASGESASCNLTRTRRTPSSANGCSDSDSYDK